MSSASYCSKGVTGFGEFIKCSYPCNECKFYACLKMANIIGWTNFPELVKFYNQNGDTMLNLVETNNHLLTADYSETIQVEEGSVTVFKNLTMQWIDLVCKMNDFCTLRTVFDKYYSQLQQFIPTCIIECVNANSMDAILVILSKTTSEDMAKLTFLHDIPRLTPVASYLLRSFISLSNAVVQVQQVTCDFIKDGDMLVNVEPPKFLSNVGCGHVMQNDIQPNASKLDTGNAFQINSSTFIEEFPTIPSVIQADHVGVGYRVDTLPKFANKNYGAWLDI